MPIRSWSVRWRLTAWYALSSLVVLIVAGTIAYYAIRATFVHDTDRSLTIAGMQVIYSAVGSELLHRSGGFIVPPIDSNTLLRKFREQLSADETDPLGDPIYIRLISTAPMRVVLMSNNVRRHDLIQRTLGPGIGYHSSQTIDGYFAGSSEYDELRILDIDVPRQPYVLQLATPWQRYEDTLDPMVKIIEAIIGFGFALSAIGGWVLVGRTLQPITEIVTEASKMSGNRLEPEFVAARTRADDEIGHLVTALNEMMGRVYRAIESQRRFTADASHDLRTPLAILRGEMELALARDRTNDEYRGVLASGLEETDRLIRIVSDLRELASADFNQEHKLHRTMIDLTELAAKVVSSRSHQAVMKNIDLTMIGPTDGLPILIEADSSAIERAIVNLLDNAINYNSTPGWVELCVRREGADAVIRIKDTGVGIEEDDRAFIFDRFYRGDKSRTTSATNDGNNSGLGLAIVKSVVTAHGGVVHVQSRLGEGSVFEVCLPLSSGGK